MSSERFDAKRFTFKENNHPLFLSKNTEMQNLVRKAQMVASSDVPVLLTGENGSGKEVLARFIHASSPRSDSPFVPVNCGAIPDELVESELFGYEKGAFTGAVKRKEGCFELASEGTLFLDEISETPLPAQVKLLRAVELKTFRRVGGNKNVDVDVRIISATNRVLNDLIKSGQFREDLYYRLNVVELYIPPLRHRKEDIPMLVNHFIDYFSIHYGYSRVDFSDEAIELLKQYDWPGNVRELKNIVEQCMVLSMGDLITPEKLSHRIRKEESAQDLAKYSKSDQDIIRIKIGSNLKDIEKKVILETLQSVDYNKTEAARVLGFSRKTLHNKLHEYEKDLNLPDSD